MWYSLSKHLNEHTADDLIGWFLHQMSVEPQTPIKLYISCGSGENRASIRVYDFLKGVPNPIETIAYGQMISPGMLAFLAGDKKTALQNTSFVLMGSFYTYEESQAQVGTYESALKLNKMEEDRMMDIIAKETNQDVTKIRELWKEGTVLTTEQAKELGLIHSISNTLPLLAPQPAKENKSEGLIN